jgi:SAM-dependent methyltransferase
MIARIKSMIKKLLNKNGLELCSIGNPFPEFPIEASLFHKELMSNAKQYSMTPSTRMWALIQSIEYINHNKILGDFVECGIWKGGNLILFSAVQEQLGMSRTIYGYDTFTGMVEPRALDLDFRGVSASEMMLNTQKIDGDHSIHAFASLDLVNKNLSENKSKNVKLIQGDVAKTLQKIENLPEKIAILRLDTDWYESTRIELEKLYPLLEPGGVLIIDDYGHYEGAQRAVDEYFSDDKPWMHYVDYSCRLIVKK